MIAGNAQTARRKRPPGGDTIFARASGAGRAGVAVYRVSGPQAFYAARRLCGEPPPPRRAALRTIRNQHGEILDQGLVILFRGPASFTGEDVAELHLHGSPAVEAGLYDAFAALGLRAAEGGEFAKRALLNGKLDLAEIEGLADLLDAETSFQRKSALGQLGGRLSTVSESWRRRLVAILAPVEAEIDFPDEGDVPAELAARSAPEIAALIGELSRHHRASAGAKAIREGVKVAIIGAPNVGKSSLLNRLAGSEKAIVAATPGTTRDVIEARLDLAGMLVSLFDTAGLRSETNDLVEREGMRRTRMTAGAADIRILMIDAVETGIAPYIVSRETICRGLPDGVTLHPVDIIVLNKIDAVKDARSLVAHDEGVFALSALTGEGVDRLVQDLSGRAARLVGGAGDQILNRARHTAAVEAAIEHLRAALGKLSAAPELAAEDVRLAARALGKITGAVDVEEVLGAIFSSFCIGK